MTPRRKSRWKKINENNARWTRDYESQNQTIAFSVCIFGNLRNLLRLRRTDDLIRRLTCSLPRVHGNPINICVSWWTEHFSSVELGNGFITIVRYLFEDRLRYAHIKIFVSGYIYMSCEETRISRGISSSSKCFFLQYVTRFWSG